MSGSKLHMTHELAGAFRQALWIGKLGSTKKPDVNAKLGKDGSLDRVVRWLVCYIMISVLAIGVVYR